MSPETQAAIDRVRASVEGKGRAADHQLWPGEDGRPVPGVAVGWSENFAGDVVLVCDAVPMSRLTPEARMLRHGSKDLAPDRRVFNHAPDLWHLLDLLNEPDAPAGEPTGDDAQ